MQTSIFTWLHVSDTHFGHGDATHGWNQNLVLSKLLEDLQQRSEPHIPVPKAIFVTGDIAFSGAVRARDEYDRARDWLNSVADALHLTSRDVFLVPGNHDVQRDVFKNDRDVWRLVDRLRSGDESIDEALAHPEDCERLSRRLKHYLDFAAQFGQETREQQRLFWVQRIPLQYSLTLRVAGLNTALLCQDDQDQGRLALGTAQLASALEPTPLTERELIVVLTHHPFTWLRDGSDVTQWIKRHGHMHLSGHVHDAESEDSRSGSGTTFVRVVAGAAHNERPPQGVPAEHGYSISAITFDSEGNLSLCVWPRRWSDRNKDFRDDVHNLPDGKTHAIHRMNMRIEPPGPALAPTRAESIQIDNASRPAGSEPLPSTAYIMELTRTSLWRKLADCCQNVEHHEFTGQLLDSVQQLSDAAHQRLANYAGGEYSDSLSDPKHPLRMLELLGRIFGDEVLGRLNAVELSLLILSAHYHDQGLLLTPSEIEALQQAPDFQVFRDNWVIEHPTLREIRQRIRHLKQYDPQRVELRHKEHQLLTGLLFDYLCMPTTWNHAERSAAYVRAQAHSDSRWTIAGHDLAAPVADICAAHLLAAHDLTMQPGFHPDRSIGPFAANMPFLAAILQIADLMDFDRERTPDSLYRSVHYTNSVSLDEWESHRHSGAWQYSGGVLRYSLPCKHPVYQRAALEFMELIERQLAATRALISSFPGTFGSYDFQFPLRIDRSRIQPETGAYVYHDLEFSLSRDEIVCLLMTDKLYSSASLCVRELLQNSLDALRYRRALFRRDAFTDWHDGKVSFTHTLDAHGAQLLRCEDNGVGMDYEIVTKFLTSVGRSFYRSPQFNQERISFRTAGVEFDPCAQFGIGFMSCFMLGDSIRISTRRDYGPRRGFGEPMIIDINGLGSMLAVRKGSPDMLPGTTVEITCREQPPFFDYWTDLIGLTEVLDGYALACEFPIQGHCDIQEIVGHIAIEPVVQPRPHGIELSRVRQYTVIEQNFQEVHPDLVGVIRAGFITDEAGTPCIENLETKWTIGDAKTFTPIALYSKKVGSMITFNRTTEGQTCVDGILVCGEPGRRRRSPRLGHQSNRITLGHTSFVLDARGTLKPPLTPARTAPDRDREIFDVRWRRLQDIASRALGRLWEKVTERMLGESHAETYWQLCQIYDVPPMTMRAEAVWSSVLFPVVAADDGTCRWRFLHDIGRVIVRGQEQGPRLETVDGFVVAPTEAMTRWDWNETARISEFYVRASLLTMARLVQHGDELWLDFPAPLSPDEALLDSWIHWGPFRFQFPLIQYGPGLETLLTAKLPVETANRDHPLIQIMLRSMYTEDRTALQQFAHAAVRCLSASETLNALAADKPAGELRKSVGHLYNAVDWTEVNTALRPPYRIRLDGTAEIEISADHFQDWASAHLDVPRL